MTARSAVGALPMRVVSLGMLVVALSLGTLLVTLPVGAITPTAAVLSVESGLTAGAESTLLYFVLWVGVVFGTVIVLLPTGSSRRGASGRR